MIYSFETDSMLGPMHYLGAMGQPYCSGFDYMTSNDLRSLVGEGFAAPCMSLALSAYVLNPWGTWWKQADPTDYD